MTVQALAVLVLLLAGGTIPATMDRAADADSGIRATWLPLGQAVLPGIAATGAPLSETPREPGNPHLSGPARRSRAARSPDRIPAVVLAGLARVHAVEREWLGFTSGLRRAHMGLPSFHSDTPPPALV